MPTSFNLTALPVSSFRLHRHFSLSLSLLPFSLQVTKTVYTRFTVGDSSSVLSMKFIKRHKIISSFFFYLDGIGSPARSHSELTLSAHDNTNTDKKRCTSMLQAGFEPTILVLERVKTFRDLYTGITTSCVT